MLNPESRCSNLAADRFHVPQPFRLHDIV
eukprot:COSAG02_NODE_49430_length_327_cov_0.451754_2_plen_28_part_01